MTLRRLISLNVALWLPVAGMAQTAAEFFNGGARLYLSNNIPAALEQTEGGLKLYPDDEKLQKLEALLKQQQQSQNQQNQQQQQNSQSQNSSSPNQQPNPQQQNQPSQSSPNEQQKPSEQPQSQQPQQSKSQAPPDKPSDPSQSQNPSPDQADHGPAMSVREAEKLLDAEKNEEKVLVLKPKGKPENDRRPVKNW